MGIPATITKRSGPMAIERAIDAIEILARHRLGLTLAELSRRLSVPKASLFEVMKGLEGRIYVSKNEAGRYEIGSSALAFARAALAANSLGQVARPILQALVRKTGETALIALLDEEAMLAVYVDKVESESPIRYTVPLGLRRELHGASVGKALLAFMPAPLREKYLASRPLERFTAATVVNVKEIRRDIETVRQTGVALTVDERTEGASGIAAPVFGAGGVLVAGLSLAGPSPRMTAGRDRFVPLVRDAAAQISAALANEETKSKVGKKIQTTQGGVVNATKAIRRFQSR
jgi:IclR family acetate operon transcriptional repressor